MGSQSDYLFGALIIGFLIFITARNELPIYIGFLLKSPAAQKSNAAGAADPNWTAQVVPADSSGKISTSDVLHTAATIAEFAL